MISRYDEEEEAFHAKEERVRRKGAPRKKEPRDLSHLSRGRIVAISGEGVLVEREGEQRLCSLKGTLRATEKAAVGDWVRFSEENNIEQIEERTSHFSRTDISGHKEQVMAANIDQVVLIVSVGAPPLKPALVDRYLIAAEKGGATPLLVVNKIDLLETLSEEAQEEYHQFALVYRELGFSLLAASAQTGEGLEELRLATRDRISLFAGQSGVGKTSLLNAAFQMQRPVGVLAEKTAKGAHTTTRAELFPIPAGGYCIDAPGVRSFSVWDLKRGDLVRHFHEFAEFSAQCRYSNCSHVDEPGCAVLQALEEGAPLFRYPSYCSLLQEIAAGPGGKTWD
ncbi:MAG: ribosome small subunit-dependent GTPase A [Verrucomicrobiota bacterium]|nr:ribosome small subunit-dependent GTPase A [Verrucomicrobiota bacterium]